MATDNPFVDPNPSFEDHGRTSSSPADATLALGRNVTLSLGTDSLIVLDESFENSGRSNCCNLWPSGIANTRAIPFYNILWAELLDSELTIQFASQAAKKRVQAATLSYPVEYQMVELVNQWVARLLDRSYGESQKRKRVKALVNPHSGKGSAEKWYYRDVEPLLKAAQSTIEMVKTRHQGEAVEIAEKMDIEAYDVVVTCSGDGLAHEVFNGLGKRADARKALSKIAVAHVPCGSGNAMSCNLNGTDSASVATLAIIKGIPTPLDLISVTQGDTRTLSFLSQSVGIVAETDLATEHLRWMGPMRFNYGFLIRLARKMVYPCDIAVKVAIDDKPSIREHYRREKSNDEPASERRGYKNLLDDDASASSGSDDGLPALRYGTINDKLPAGWELIPHDKMGNFYCGNMAYMTGDANFFPAALPNDGYMDLVCINGDISRLTAVQMMLNVESNKFFDMPGVWYRKILGYRIIPKDQEDGYISIDGERVPFQPFQTEVHKGLGTVLSKTGHMYEAPGPV
ncbi:Sphingoid long chain base kinase-like protein [Venustampulla echinocandica]|uniref:Sphingoid long chain base kinase-like protein n=1 Tax=Venustampulla echinocandica TaxID=2656787 RepID=A0A370U3A0_9HELO|nr:Sphingoid long chain base kinase-like protein [Venustampulla echinocandica]RDL42242.1 Sphingoid long chain base kinase-like protein [Venustampulla echinocandica]